MSRLLYLDAPFGISGDMMAAALLDLGADYNKVQKALDSLLVSGFEVVVTRKKKAALDVCDFDVVLDSEHDNHDHDMEYLHGHEHHYHGDEHDALHHHYDYDGEYKHHHHHDDEHEHMHDHEQHHHSDEYMHEHEHHHHHHEHRGLQEIRNIIDVADMTANAKSIALHIFDIIARAEAKAHGTTIENVHFHEVGAVDSIVDIVTIAVCLDDINADGVVVKALNDGCGTIRCQHGIIPVPVPAVANIAAAEGLTLNITDVKGELVTPTGAAVAAAIRTTEEMPAGYRLKKIGLGGGKREYSVPGILRVMLFEQDEASLADTIVKLESNIDDCTGENLGYVMELLMNAGARDVFYTPIFMKKNRPAYLLSVICTQEKARELEKIIFLETTTIGIRRQIMERSILPRAINTIHTPIGEADVKVCEIDGMTKVYPEYESVKRLCRATGKHFNEVIRIVLAAVER